jgi:hypothetical protein
MIRAPALAHHSVCTSSNLNSDSGDSEVTPSHQEKADTAFGVLSPSSTTTQRDSVSVDDNAAARNPFLKAFPQRSTGQAPSAQGSNNPDQQCVHIVHAESGRNGTHLPVATALSVEGELQSSGIR